MTDVVEKDAGSVPARWFVWMWQHYSLVLTDHRSEAEAIAYAISVEDNGDGSLGRVEGPDGVIPDDVIQAARNAHYEAQLAELRAEPKNTHRVDVLAPDGKHKACWGGFTNLESAEQAATGLRSQFGDRVSVARNGK